MQLGCRVLIKHNEKVVEGNVEKILQEDLHIKLEDGTIVMRKYWQIRKIKNEKDER